MLDIKHLLYLAPLAGVAFADLELDRDDVPPPCRDICQPIVDLTQRCEVDIRGSTDREEDRLERQCICTNDSFDVGRIAGLCASCFQQNFRTPDNDDDDDDDDNDTTWDDDDIREIMRDCNFSSESYSSQLSTAAQTINVVASAPTAVDQLTTTIDRNNNSPQPTGSNNNDNSNNNNGGSGNSNNDDDNNNNNNNNSNDNNNDDNSNSNNDDSSQTTNSDNPDETDFAVPGAVPLGGFSAVAVLGVFGAMAAGGAFLL